MNGVPFDSSTLAALRASVLENLPGSAVIMRPSAARNAAGGGTVTMTARATVPCSVGMAKQPIEAQPGGAGAYVATYQIALPWNTDVKGRDQIVSGGNTYEVIGHNAGNSSSVCVTVWAVLLGG